MSIDNFTNSLIEMAEAVKAKPELEAKLASLEADNAICYDSLNIKQMQIANLETELAEAKARLEEARRDRDEAMFRNLELEERIEQFSSMAGKMLNLVRPSQTVEPAPVAVADPNPAVTAEEERYWESLKAEEYKPADTQGYIKLDPYPEPDAPANPADTPAKPYYEYPYSWKPSSMSDEEWTLNGGHPNPDKPADTWPF